MKQLTKVESDLVPFVARLVRKSKGSENAITAKGVVKAIAKKYPAYKMSDARVRRIINFIRVNGIVKNLLASSKGYFVERDSDMVKQYVKSLLTRSRAVMEVAMSYKQKV